MTNTEQLSESLDRLEQMRIAFKTGNVATLGGVDGLIAELLKVLRILIEERTSYANDFRQAMEVLCAVDPTASEVPLVKRFAPKRSAKGKDAG